MGSLFSNWPQFLRRLRFELTGKFVGRRGEFVFETFVDGGEGFVAREAGALFERTGDMAGEVGEHDAQAVGSVQTPARSEMCCSPSAIQTRRSSKERRSLRAASGMRSWLVSGMISM